MNKRAYWKPLEGAFKLRKHGHSRVGGNPVCKPSLWIPACAGMTLTSWKRKISLRGFECKLLQTSIILVLLLSMAPASAQEMGSDAAAGGRPVEVLFLGHASEHHNSAAFMPLLAAPLAQRGIHLTYVESPEAALAPDVLRHYDALLLYANHDSITAAQEEALLDFVEGGGGFIPVHSASWCFRNSNAFVELVGGQFSTHETGTFTAEIVHAEHPAMADVEPFETWDETYVHDHLTDDRTVLMERVEIDSSGGEIREPYTWVREQGEGRVFYTAYGHDERTWGNEGFQKLIEGGILWAVGDSVRAAWDAFAAAVPELVYHEAKLPNYEQRDPPPKMQEPLSPEESQKLIHVPPQFELELFAAEPDIVKPVTMAFDERGRLWIVETEDYPNTVRPEGTGPGPDQDP